MKIYISHSSGFDFKGELYQPIRKLVLNKQHEIILPHENSGEPYLVKDNLPKFDLILAEVSYPSTGQGIELDWFSIYKVPIACFYKKGSKVSSSLKTISNKFIEYLDTADMIKKLEILIQSFNAKN